MTDDNEIKQFDARTSCPACGAKFTTTVTLEEDENDEITSLKRKNELLIQTICSIRAGLDRGEIVTYWDEAFGQPGMISKDEFIADQGIPRAEAPAPPDDATRIACAIVDASPSPQVSVEALEALKRKFPPHCMVKPVYLNECLNALIASANERTGDRTVGSLKAELDGVYSSREMWRKMAEDGIPRADVQAIVDRYQSAEFTSKRAITEIRDTLLNDTAQEPKQDEEFNDEGLNI